MPPRPRKAPKPRPRTPTPEEARLLTVYMDAERYVLERTRVAVVDVADAAQAGRPADNERVTGARRLREAVEGTVRGLDKGAPGRAQRIIDAAREQGVNAAAAELAELTEGVALGRSGRAPINRGALDRLAAETIALTQTAHTAILRTTDDAYRQAVERTVSGVLVGADTRRDAAQRAMWALTDQGITGFTDRAGRRWRLSSYVEMATRTAAARAFVDAQLDELYAQGSDYVIVSSAPAECSKCTPWEGAVLGIDPEAATGAVTMTHALTGEPVVVQVAGTVAQARAAGLLHPNCRHTVGLYLPGVTRTDPADPSIPGRYEASQRQREIERHIRAWRERQAAAVTPAARRQAAAKVREWRAAMDEHLTEHPYLARQREREAVDAGNAPSAALRARVAARAPRPAPEVGPARTAEELAEHYRATVGNPPAAERKALFEYTGGEFVGLNAWLRGNDLAPPSNPDSYYADIARPQAAALNRLAERYRTDRPVRVRRYVHDNALPDGLAPGRSWDERGFTSTTLGEPTVEFRNRPVVLDIEVQPGSRAIVVNALGKGVAAESEVVLPPGTRFTLLDESVGEQGERVLRVRAEDPTAPEPRVSPIGEAVKGRRRTVRQLSDDELDRTMREALAAEEFDRFEVLADESDRRQAQRAAAAERAQARRDAVEAERRAREDAQLAEFERLLDSGYSDEQATEEVYGITVEKQRRDAAAASLRADGYRGTWREMTRAAYKDELVREFRRASEEAGGFFVRRGAPDRVTEEAVFTGNEAFARRWASPELLEWWDANGRLTYDAYLERLVNGRGTAAGEDFLR